MCLFKSHVLSFKQINVNPLVFLCVCSYKFPSLRDTALNAIFLLMQLQHSTNISRVNKGMSLEDFKFIYWMEYAHRMWGRALGFVFAGPFAYFIARGYVTRQLGIRLSALFALGGAQGLIGWWMVKSGLEVFIRQCFSCLTTLRLGTSLFSFHLRNQHLSMFNQGLALTGWQLTWHLHLLYTVAYCGLLCQ